MQRVVFFWQRNRGDVQGWIFSLLFHGVFVGVTVLTMANLMEVKKPEPIRLDMALVKPPPKPIPQVQPVEKTVVEQQRLERQEFEKEVSKKEIIDNEIVEQQIEMNKVSRQEVVDQVLVKQKKLTEQRTKQTTTEQEIVQVADTVETQVPQQQKVTSQAVPRVAAATPVTSAVSVKPASNTNHRQVATIAQPTVKGDREVKRPSTVKDVPVVSVEKTTTTEFTTQHISASVKRVAAVSSGSVSTSATRVHHTPTQRSTAARVVSKIQATKALAVHSAPRQVIEETALTKIQPPVITREIEQIPFALTDYNWIADTLSERVQQLKRYPNRAKRRMWEGTVELRVSIRADGEIQDVHVLESSGHRILDQDALKTVRLASPLTLNHLVDRPTVMIDLPIVYELN